MRRMYSPKELLARPSESNKVFCQQFVADSVVINNAQPGYYLVKLINTDGDNTIFNDFQFDFKYESTYGTIISSFVYDPFNDKIFALKGEWSANSNTLTFTLIDTMGATIQSPRDIHIDIYKLD